MSFFSLFLSHHVSSRKRWRTWMAISAAAMLLSAAAPAALAQQDNAAEQSSPHSRVFPGGPPAGGNHPDLGRTAQEDPAMRNMMRHMALERDNDRQKQIVADTAKLLKLAKQLHADVAKSNVNTLSVPVVKDAAEIEKLAKSIKDKMKNGY